MTQTITTPTGRKIDYTHIEQRVGNRPLEFQFTGEEARAIVRAGEQAIDSHLESCHCPERGDSYM